MVSPFVLNYTAIRRSRSKIVIHELTFFFSSFFFPSSFSFLFRVKNWSVPSKGGFIDTGYVGYVQVGDVDRLVVEAELSNCAGSTPMYAVEAFILCHEAVETVICFPDTEKNTINATVVKNDADRFQTITTKTILSDLLEGFENVNITIDSSVTDQDNIDTSTRDVIISFLQAGKVDFKML